jgi:hypothetical protein
MAASEHVPPCGGRRDAWSRVAPVIVNVTASGVHPGPFTAPENVVMLQEVPAPELLLTVSVPVVQVPSCVTPHVQEHAVAPTLGGPATSCAVKFAGHEVTPRS